MLVLAGTFTWTGGTITGVVQCNGTGTIGTGSGKSLPGGQLINAGTLNWNDTIFMGGASTPTLISNLPGAMLTLTAGVGTVNEGGSGTQTIANNGTITMTGAGTSYLSPIFNNAGTVTNSGVLNLGGGGTETGAFMVLAGSTLNLSGGTFGFNSGSSISGAGALTVSGSTANFAGTCTLSTPTVNITGGAGNFNNNGTVISSLLNVSGGTLGSSNPVLVSGTFTWTGGTITGVVQCNGTGTIGTGSGKYLPGGQLINAGTLNWNDTIFMGGASTPTLISNLPGAMLTLTAGVGTVNEGGSGTQTIANNGTITMTGAGTSYLSPIFNNAGTCEQQWCDHGRRWETRTAFPDGVAGLIFT